jgi:deoxyribodipyrimidine photo-lyase
MVGTIVIRPEKWRKHDDAPVKIDFWLRNLRALWRSRARLNIPPVIVRAECMNHIADCLLEVVRSARCDARYCNHEYEINERRRDEAVFRKLQSAGVQAKGFHDHVLLDPASIRTDERRCYSVFTPFRRRVLQRLKEQPVGVLPEPNRQPAIEV